MAYPGISVSLNVVKLHADDLRKKSHMSSWAAHRARSSRRGGRSTTIAEVMKLLDMPVPVPKFTLGLWQNYISSKWIPDDISSMNILQELPRGPSTVSKDFLHSQAWRRLTAINANMGSKIKMATR